MFIWKKFKIRFLDVADFMGRFGHFHNCGALKWFAKSRNRALVLHQIHFESRDIRQQGDVVHED